MLRLDLTDDFIKVVNEDGVCFLCADKSNAAIAFLDRAVDLINRDPEPLVIRMIP